MQTFQLPAILSDAETAQRRWSEFLRADSLSMGLYRLKAGEADPQQPHTEDEVYYVLKGAARFRAGEREVAVQSGAVLFVERLVEHRFFDISEDLTVLVLFAPAEGTQSRE